MPYQRLKSLYHPAGIMPTNKLVDQLASF